MKVECPARAKPLAELKEVGGCSTCAEYSANRGWIAMTPGSVWPGSPIRARQRARSQPCQRKAQSVVRRAPQPLRATLSAPTARKLAVRVLRVEEHGKIE